ncbi:BrnT family toxin, partial [Porphyrobacter sp. TH134]|uniref:BrnT family toxin n=1 Tax=Porphyrobacter sp. TH134 TaxID=2067450 RepID=UPI000C7CCDC9
MEIEFDENKRLSNLAKHGLDFLDAPDVFAGEFVQIEDLRQYDSERRYQVLEPDSEVHVIWQWLAMRRVRRRIWAMVVHAVEL